MQTTFGTRLLISKADLSTTKVDISPPPAASALNPGEILCAVDRVALTANNITYAAAGDAFGYWSFFPAPEGYGIVPVWGFADVIASRAEGIQVGDRYYGYWPLATHLLCQTADISAAGFSDPGAHRQKLGAFYNRYMRTSADAGYAPDTEDLQCLFRPLFTTAFLIDGFLAQNDFFGARQIILSSASSKTALALAFLLHKARRDTVKIIGLTSPRNWAFVTGLGSYDDVIPYTEIASISADTPTVYVDFAGDRSVTKAVHTHVTEKLMHSATVGMTHWSNLAAPPEVLPGSQPVLFFAPSVAEAQVKSIGPAVFGAALGAAWQAFTPHARHHLAICDVAGMTDAQAQFLDLVAGKTPPASGIILRLG